MIRKINFLILIFMISIFSNPATASYDKLAYDFNFVSIEGSSLNLSKFKGKIIIVINVASKCGFTNQYKDMQQIWEKYKNKGVVILGVPSNDFGQQEPENNEDIKKFCETNFGISFPMTEKVSVKGSNAHPFYNWAKKNYGNSAVPKWNFHKIIINKNGKIENTFSSFTKPTSKKFISALEKMF